MDTIASMEAPSYKQSLYDMLGESEEHKNVRYYNDSRSYNQHFIFINEMIKLYS